MSKAEIQFDGFDQGSDTPRYRIDCGTNTTYRLDVTTDAQLLEPAQEASRRPNNFWTSNFVALPSGGAATFALPAAAWSALDKGGRLYHRLSTRDATGGNLLRSVAFGSASSAPSFSTAAPTVTHLLPNTGPSAGGTTVVVHGTELSHPRGVNLGGRSVAFRAIDDASLEITTPPSAGALAVALAVDTRFGKSAASTAATFTYAQPVAPAITSPAPGATLATAEVTFTWSANGHAVTEWWLSAEAGTGTTRETRSVRSDSLGPTSGTISGLPLDGSPVRVTLFYKIGDTWAEATSAYTMRADPVVIQARQQAERIFELNAIPISDDDLEYPDDGDVLVLIHGNRAVVLPASWNMVTARAPVHRVEPITVFSMATVGKEGFYLVNIGGRLAYAMDAGGSQKVVFPHALGLALQSLGVARVDGVILKHIDTDHVRNFLHFMQKCGVFPRNIHFSDAFIAGTAQGQRLAEFHRLVTGVFPNAPFGVIATPAPGTSAVFTHTVNRGDVTFELVGHVEIFDTLKRLRLANERQEMAGVRRLRDAAIPLVKITHQPSGIRILDITDLRGSDLMRYERAMGSEEFNRFVGDARVIIGANHHMGSATTAEDRAGLLRLVTETYLRNGRLDLFAQSRATPETATSGFRLNRSMVRLLRDFGVNVHLALDAVGNSVGTLSFQNDERVVHRGGGIVDSGSGDPVMQRAAASLANLRMLRALARVYNADLSPGMRATLQGIGAVADAYQQRWINSMRIGLECNADSPRPIVLEPTRYAAALADARQIPFEMLAMSSGQLLEAEETLRSLRIRDAFRAEVERIRQGRITPYSLRTTIRLLRVVSPARAGEWINASNLEKRERERMLRMLNIERPPTAVRIAHVGLLALVVAAEIARWMPLLRARWYQQDVKPFLEAIVWWQQMGIQPLVKGLDDNALSSDELTTSPERVAELARSGELDAVAVTGLPAVAPDEVHQWDILGLRLASLCSTYLDWTYYVRESPAIRFGDNHYEYKVGDVVSTLTDYDVTEQWIESPEMSNVLRGVFQIVRELTTEDIQALRHGPGPIGGPSFQDRDYPRKDSYAGFPQPRQVARFRPGLTGERRLYVPGESQYYIHWPDDALFYVFPDSQSPDPVPADHIVVGGATFDTYAAIVDCLVMTSINALDPQGNIVQVGVTRRPNYSQVMWARAADVIVEPL